MDKKVWQYFTVVPDFKAVGVRDNARSMGYMVVIRAVNTIDAMTATIERIDYDILERIVVPDFKAVGVRDNARSMGYMVVIRAVNTIDAMTATIERIDYDILERICARITAEVPSVSRVC